MCVQGSSVVSMCMSGVCLLYVGTSACVCVLCTSACVCVLCTSACVCVCAMY